MTHCMALCDSVITSGESIQTERSNSVNRKQHGAWTLPPYNGEF